MDSFVSSNSLMKQVALPKLTRSNFVTTFKPAFKEIALLCGEAGEIIINGIDIKMRKPERQMFPDDQRGDKNFDKYERKYDDLKEGKKKLISLLLIHSDKEIKDSLTTSDGYQQAHDTFDLLAIWQMVEQVVVGRGAISVYSLIVRLLRCKQEENYNTFEKEYKELVIDLMAHGTHEEILKMIFNALFILALDQEQFKEKLTPIYGRREWPDYDELSIELHNYSESTMQMKSLMKNNNDGKIAAYQTSSADINCWNCGKRHAKFSCPDQKHSCKNCGVPGHLEQYCEIRQKTLQRSKSKQKDSNPKDDDNPDNNKKSTKKIIKNNFDKNFANEKNKTRTLQKNATKSSSRARLLKKAIAQLIEFKDENDDDSTDDDSHSQAYQDEDNLDAYDTDANLLSLLEPLYIISSTNPITPTVTSSLTSLAYSAEEQQPRYILDTGCKNAHVIKTAGVLTSHLDTSSWPRLPVVQGATGDVMPTTDVGIIGNLGGTALVAPRSSKNLLSLMEIVKHHKNSTFSGDANHLIIHDSGGTPLLTAHNIGDDFWSCSEHDLITSADAMTTAVSTNLPENIPTGDNTTLVPEAHTQLLEEPPSQILQIPNPLTNIPSLAPPGLLQERFLRLNAHERVRAKAAYKLCDLLRHPGDHAVIMCLEGGHFHNLNLTAQDFRNARLWLGPCASCAEAKMTAPTEPTTLTPRARSIGDKVHSDFILLSGPSLGGNLFILAFVDECSTYIIGVPGYRKTTSSLKLIGTHALLEYNMYRHAVRHLLTDDESCLATLRVSLGPFGVTVSATPAGLHEKTAEVNIRTIKDRQRSIISSLPYELPPDLECESFMEAITWINNIPNTITGPFTTPLELFTGSKPFLPSFKWGDFGLFYHKRKDSNLRSEWGIFVGYGRHPRYLRCYNPLTRSITSKRKFLPQTSYPVSWNLKPRLRSLSSSLPFSSLPPHPLLNPRI